jgi:hypothetical protein
VLRIEVQPRRAPAASSRPTSGSCSRPRISTRSTCSSSRTRSRTGSRGASACS